MSEQNTDNQLNLNDFQNVVRLIDMAAQRGAVRGDEMVTLGTLRAKFAAFLEQNAQAAQQPAPAQQNERGGEPQTGEGEKEYPATEG